MKGLKKRMLSLVTALAIGCGLLTPMGGAIPQAYAAQAEQTEQSGQYAGITWRYANHTLTLSGGPLPDAPQEGGHRFSLGCFRPEDRPGRAGRGRQGGQRRAIPVLL